MYTGSSVAGFVRKCLSLVVLAILFSAVIACAEKDMASEPRQVGPSPDAARWLGIAEDPKKDIQERIKAAYQLRVLKEEATVDRLAKLLPADRGALALQIIGALHEIRSPRALPALNK